MATNAAHAVSPGRRLPEEFVRRGSLPRRGRRDRFATVESTALELHFAARDATSWRRIGMGRLRPMHGKEEEAHRGVGI
jgi:hypothetical protein